MNKRDTDVKSVLWKWFWNVLHLYSYQWYYHMFQIMSCDVKKVLSKQATSNWCIIDIPLFICYCVGSITRQRFIYLITIVSYESYWPLKRYWIYQHLIITCNYLLRNDYSIRVTLISGTLFCLVWEGKEDSDQNDNVQISTWYFLGPVCKGFVGW